jgi:hypothetical protein
MATSEVVRVETKQIESGLANLRDRANAIVVKDADSYAAACQVALDGRAYIKRVGFELDPGIASAKDHLDLLKNQKAKFVDPAKQIVEVAAQKAEAWKTEERRKAAAEQERINEERRREAARIAEEERQEAVRKAIAEQKEREAEIARQRAAGELKKREADKLAKLAAQQAEAAIDQAADAAATAAASVQEVRVAPAVPKVAGIKARVNYKFKITDESKLPRNFLMADEVAIGQFIRAEKRLGTDIIPGVEVWSEDGI